MRRFSSASIAALTAVLLFTALWSACGGGSSDSATFTISKFVFSPTIINLEPGQVLTVGATPYNSSGGIVSATVTYSLKDGTQTSSAISISPGGSLCAGQWDATFTLCSVTPTPAVGQYTIVASANGATGNATVFIHYHVDAVYLHAPTAACVSSGKTAGVTPYACTANTSAVAGCTTRCVDNTNMCDITSSVGAFNYNVVDSTVASIDSTGTLTAGAPGTTKVYASVSAANGGNSSVSSAVPYTTCLVDSISLHVASKTDTSLTVAGTASGSLQADVLDSAGQSITPTITFNNLQAAVGTASGSTNTGTYAGKAPGYGQVVASCTPPNCNQNAAAVFSNVLSTTVQTSGTSGTVTANETNVYVTGVGAVQMYPVDSTKFTLGSVMSLPFPANSMAIARDGSHIFLGSDKFAMVITTASNSVQALSFPGRVLAVAPNNAYVIFASSAATNNVYIMSGTSLTIANPGGFTIPGVTAASFTPDGNTVYFSAGSALYRYRIVGDGGSTPAALTLTGGGAPLSSAPSDVKTSANGTAVFSALPSNSTVVADETCNAFVNNAYTVAFEQLGTPIASATSALAAIPNGTGMLAVNGSALDELNITAPNPLTTPFAGCPATPFTITPSTISLSAMGSGFTVNQLVVSNSGRYAAILANCTTGTCAAQVGIVDLTTGTLTPVPFVNKGTTPLHQAFSGDFLLDDSGIWVGADDSNGSPLGTIHFISTSSLADTEQVNVQIQAPTTGSTPVYVNPSLIAVQRK
jgi:hypothetical protein